MQFCQPRGSAWEREGERKEGILGGMGTGMSFFLFFTPLPLSFFRLFVSLWENKFLEEIKFGQSFLVFMISSYASL